MQIKTWLNDLIALIYPNVCLLCGEMLNASENQVCMLCLFKIPKTDYHLLPDNPVEKRFWGKVKIERATACFLFQKQTNIQKLLHQLKYKGNQDMGRTLGEYFANEIQTSPFHQGIDYIIPVPLHKNRFRKRGYNQSACIGEGLSRKLNIPMETYNLIRVIEKPTQTKKGVFERWENTHDIFSLVDNTLFEGKHILLIDDVLTTGSTLEACAHAVLQAENAKVSIAALAVA